MHGVGLSLAMIGSTIHRCIVGSISMCNIFNLLTTHPIIVPILSAPTYSQCRNLRTIIVIADIHQGLQRSAYASHNAR